MADVSQATGADAPFETFAALQRAHLDFRQSAKARPGAGSGHLAVDAARAFVARARASGAYIEDANERNAAQAILDYWSAELVSSPGATADDFMPVLLASFDAARAAPDTAPAQAPAEESAERPREAIRIAAAARLWRDSGKQRGYLLWGEAEIARAAQYRDLDPDIAELVQASEEAGRTYTHKKYAVLSVLTVVLFGLLLAVTMLYISERSKSQLLQDETAELKNQSEEFKKALDDERKALAIVRQTAETADALDRRLELMLSALRQLYQRKVITRADLPEEIAAAVEAVLWGPKPPAQVAADAGYAADFVGVPIPLPAAAARRPRADYANYSVVLDAHRRLAVVAASNLDREKRVVLPRTAAGFTADPNLPADVQADPDWFKSPQVDYGHLATRQEISWGPAFRGDDPDSASKLVHSVNVLTNVAPQFDTFNRFVWTKLEQWIVASHHRKAARVTILTGPVLAADDPVVDGVSMPRRFWKIAVSQRAPGAQQLIADAFMIAQFRDGTDQKAERQEFAPERFRVTVAEIERLTGLDFGAAVRAAETSDALEVRPEPVSTRPKSTVYFQFAGMSREEAVAISRKLKALGWAIPGEERTGAAAKQSEVRYGAEADRPVAEQLVADLKALGFSRMSAKRNASIKPAFLEIWVSQ